MCMNVQTFGKFLFRNQYGIVLGLRVVDIGFLEGTGHYLWGAGGGGGCKMVAGGKSSFPEGGEGEGVQNVKHL